MSPRLLLTRYVVHWLASRERKKMELAIENPREAQKRVLREILKITGREQLPESPTQYSDYPHRQSWTTDSVKFFETTSGNSGKKKEIPYSERMLKSFQTMFILWADDVLTHQKLKSGKLFISISPKLESMGMDSDLDYLSPFLKKLVGLFLAVPMSDFVAKDGDEFFSKVALNLLKCRDLECISIWSPSYLISLLNYLFDHRAHWAGKIDRATMSKVETKNWKDLWPKLKLISCWTDGSSQLISRKIRLLFPNSTVQGKGLLATEAPISLPWHAAMGCLPMWNEVYLEYIDSMGKIKPLYEMSTNQTSEILVSTKGGLLRYRLGDIIECAYRYKGSPVIKFVRRSGEVSDMVGEKLDASLLMDVLSDYKDIKWILVANVDHYVFVSDSKVDASELEAKLQAIHHYKLARELGQLSRVVSMQDPDLAEKLNQYHVAKKIKIGDIKFRLLWNNPQILGFLKNSRSLDSSL